MVAIVNTSTSIHRTLHYNEQKLKEGKAIFIDAANYPKDAEQLNFYQKLNRLTHQAALNENVTRNSVHISLNFDPKEQLTDATLRAIANTYMQKIGFEKQPYLVYKHMDAGHPHIHIVSIKVKEDGKRIDMQNMGRNQSTTARKEIENEFALIKADERKLTQAYQPQPIDPQKLQYGKSETKRAVTNILDKVMNQYKYTSLAELNAILKQYNIVADRGAQQSRVYKNNGLQYKVLDANGKPTGVPIKASSIYNKPTLKNLEKHFEANEQKRLPDKSKLKTDVDWVLHHNPKNLKEFTEALKKEQVQVVLWQNDKGQVYGLTYIDYRTKSVFNGSDLGKSYSSAGIQERLDSLRKDISVSGMEKNNTREKEQPQPSSTVNESKHYISKESKREIQENFVFSIKENNAVNADLLEQLMRAEKANNRLPYELLKKKRKRKPNSS
jgi:hypothetical protein